MAEDPSGRISRQDIQLSPIQTSFTRGQSQRLQRARPVEIIVFETPMNPPPREDLPLLIRQKSKGSLFRLFSRSKSAETARAYPKSEISRISEEASGKVHPSEDSDKSKQTSNSFYPLQTHIPSAQLDPATTKLPRRTSKIRLNTKLDKKDFSLKNLASWDPPELFKAYPQAVKHAKLRAPFLQAETILQFHEEKKQASLGQSGEKDEMDEEIDSVISEGFRRKRQRDKKSKDMTTELCYDKWTERVYVLATSGCLLQYAGSGKFDRLPEKIMRLGKESAAFASDAIDGEFYVLQVSKTTNEEGVVNMKTSNSVFKKLGFRNETKSTSSFLLVFDSPDDMNEWLVVMRKEIEALGGRKYRPDVLVRRNTEDSRQLRERPSRRFLVQREPYRFAEQTPDRNMNIIGRHERPLLGNIEGSLTAFKRLSMATQNSGDSPSLSNGTASSDQAYLERLRETPRLSYVSTGAKTLPTSKASSPDPSPARATFSPEDLIPKPTESLTLTLGIPQPQRSLARTVPESTLPAISIINEKQEPELIRVVSTCGPSIHRNPSPPPPNFSIPRSSKHYSLHNSEHSTPCEQYQQPTARRFPSLENPQQSSSRHSISTQSPAPHPPPTTALPALPQVHSHDHRRSSENTVKYRKAQRPISLQVRSDPIVYTKYHPLEDGLQGPSEEDENLPSSHLISIPKPRRAPPPPPIPILKSNIQNRRSMPQITHGTPSGPLSDFSSLPDISFLLDSENSIRGSFLGPWGSSDAVRGNQSQDSRIK